MPKTITVPVVKQADGKTAKGSMNFEELFSGITFSAPGVYIFELKEVPGNNPNIVYDNSVYTVKVQVTWDDVDSGDLKIEAIKIYDATAAKKDTAAFNNTPNTNVGTLNVTKIVAGNSANTNDVFTFKVTLGGVTGTHSATINGVATTPAQNGDNTYTLKHDETLVINNLPVGATYTVTETDAKGYTVTDSQTTTAENLAEGAIASGANGVTFTNTKNVQPIMGVFMDVLPYALIVVVAAAACFFFMTRRRNREDY